MPILLLRSASSTPLSSLVESAQKKVYPLFQYELQLRDNCLELTLVGKLERKLPTYSTDEGFESDIDSLSLVSSDNDSFTTEKLVTPSSKTIETDSANGSSSSDSDTETSESKSKEISQEPQSELLDKNPKQSFNLVDCVCYTDVKCTDILIFVIKSETFVFKFEDVKQLEKFYTNFTTLKALTNQKLFNKNFETKFNLLQVTDRNGITHIEVTREADLKSLNIPSNGPNSIISIPTDETDRVVKTKDANSRQRLVSNIDHSPAATKKIPKSSSLENIVDVDDVESELVNKESNIKVWNSAEDLLDPPKRPERRKKNKAPPPPQKPQNENVLSGKFVRVKVNLDSVNPLDKERLIVKTAMHEPHPKKLQFSMFSTKPSFTSLLKKDKHVLRYEPKKLDINNFGRSYGRNDSNGWTNSVPRLLKKPKTRNPTPMAYRYIDTAQDYPLTHNKDHNSNFVQKYVPAFGHNAAFSNYLRGETSSPNIGNRIFGLNPRLKDLQFLESAKDNAWKPVTDSSKDNNLKSVIKGSKDDIKKKNDKKVTFSAYTTVQVV